jgi:phage head maturation protease
LQIVTFTIKMADKYQKKYNSCKTLDIDTVQKQVKVAIAEMETVDRDGEVFDPKAFNKTIKENGPQGTNEIWHLLDHDNNSFSALSKFKEVGIDGKYLFGVSQYKDSFAWREVAWPLYEHGDFTQHSVGFTSTGEKVKNKDGSVIITSARVWEGSAVLWGANPNTPVMGIQKSIKSLFDDAELDESEIIEHRFNRLIKRIQDEKFTEQNKNLLTIELLRLQSIYKATPPIEKIKEPDFEAQIKAAFNLFNSKSI